MRSCAFNLLISSDLPAWTLTCICQDAHHEQQQPWQAYCFGEGLNPVKVPCG